MNRPQQLWWQQATSDQQILHLMERHSAPPCQQLHYLQMVAEKIGKAYFWRTGHPPPLSHASFVRFLQALDNRTNRDRDRIAHLFGFGRGRNFGNWIPTIIPLAHELQNLAPDLAGDGPNPEYPWPRAAPQHAPVGFGFGIWRRLTESGPGRQLRQVINAAVNEFPKYA